MIKNGEASLPRAGISIFRAAFHDMVDVLSCMDISSSIRSIYQHIGKFDYGSMEIHSKREYGYQLDAGFLEVFCPRQIECPIIEIPGVSIPVGKSVILEYSATEVIP